MSRPYDQSTSNGKTVEVRPKNETPETKKLEAEETGVINPLEDGSEQWEDGYGWAV